MRDPGDYNDVVALRSSEPSLVYRAARAGEQLPLIVPHQVAPLGKIAISVGLAVGGTDRLLRRADAALYRAKADGRNRTVAAADKQASGAARRAAASSGQQRG